MRFFFINDTKLYLKDKKPKSKKPKSKNQKKILVYVDLFIPLRQNNLIVQFKN